MPRLLVADSNKKIFDIPFLNACGSKLGAFFALDKSELIKLPAYSELFVLPDRQAVGYSDRKKEFITVKGYSAVSAFISPGYTALYSAAYEQDDKAAKLPLFCYSPVCFYKGEFYVPAIQVDKDKRHNLKYLPIDKVKQNINKFHSKFTKNRLFMHLTNCALVYNCPNGKNFFLQQYECPLPVSSKCNARCAGCISLQAEDQEDSACPATQPRIDFKPSAEEISQIALFHIENAKKPIVSFGQGCEGEPLMEADTIIESIKLIRKNTKKGTIHLNTNASKPEMIKELFKCGLNSMRVSMNSAREEYYNLYYRPLGYSFNDVLKSIEYAKKANGFVSLNYLTMPGFTDNKDELKALLGILKQNKIDMIQWRNLNYDILAYCKLLKINSDKSKMTGIKEIMEIIKQKFPAIRFGYFNPSL